MKKAFSLIEILIAITIFTFIILSLYKVIDIAKEDINKISNTVKTEMQSNHNKNILMEDFLESKQINIGSEEENILVKLITNNTYHNSLFTNIVYILQKGSLYRVESLNVLSKDNIYSINRNNIFIDLIYSDIEKIFIKEGKNHNYFIYIKSSIDDKEIIISVPYSLNTDT